VTITCAPLTTIGVEVRSTWACGTRLTVPELKITEPFLAIDTRAPNCAAVPANVTLPLPLSTVPMSSVYDPPTKLRLPSVANMPLLLPPP